MVDYLNIDHNTVEPYIIMVCRCLVGTIELSMMTGGDLWVQYKGMMGMSNGGYQSCCFVKGGWWNQMFYIWHDWRVGGTFCRIKVVEVVLILMKWERKEGSLGMVGFVVESQIVNYNRMTSKFKRFHVIITFFVKIYKSIYWINIRITLIDNEKVMTYFWYYSSTVQKDTNVIQ